MAKSGWPKGIRPHGGGLNIRIRHKGRTFSWTFCSSNPPTRAELKAAIKFRTEKQFRLQHDLPLGDDQEPGAQFFEAAQQYLNGLDVKRSTRRSYVAILNAYWLPILGSRPLNGVKPSEIGEVLASLDVSQKTKKNVLIPLTGVFEAAMQDGRCDTNPCRSVRLKKHQKPPIQRFTRAESDLILKTLEGISKDHALRALIMLDLGLRSSEVSALTWEDYDGEFIRVYRGVVRRRLSASTKTHEQRSVFVSPRVRKGLASHPVEPRSRFIFTNAVGQYRRDTDLFNEVWKEALSRAGIAYRIPYTLRHTRAAQLLSMGIEPAFAAQQLGHTTQMFFGTYSEWIDEIGRERQLNKLRGPDEPPDDDPQE